MKTNDNKALSGVSHTPGPWVVEAISGRFNILSSCSIGYGIAQVGYIGHSNCGVPVNNTPLTNDIDEANAALIAAAPELLDCLKRLVERIDFNGGLGEYKGGPSFVMKQAKEAIKKAEGHD